MINNKRFLLLTDAMVQGGAERQLAYLAIGLKRRGNEVRLITFYPEKNFYEEDLTKEGIHTEYLPNGENGLKRAKIIFNLVKSWKPDLTVCYKSGSSMAACIARMFSKFNLAVSERNTNQGISKRDRLRFFLYNWAHHIVPNSFSQADFIKKNFTNLYSKVKVITNMIDLDKFRMREIIPENQIPQIITTARITPQKNVLRYLEAIKALKNRNIKCHFNWWGRVDDNSDYWEKVKAKIQEYQIEDMVTFYGPTKNVIEEYYKNDLFLLPSLYEGFPNVLCEAMACGLPSIATDVCDSPYILQEKKYLVDPYNPEDMANKIVSLLFLSKDKIKMISKKNRQRIESLCSEEQFINSYLNLLIL